MRLMGSLRIAMWSGPRNISTAMMRAWENRSDTVVWDEPFYGDYLRETGFDHPMRDDILETCETNWREVVARLTGPVPDGKSVFFQKHMTHHMLPHIDRTWMADVKNCFLIRDPKQVIASYAIKRDFMTFEDIGFDLQAELFDDVCQITGNPPPVLDASDVLTNPEGILRRLCAELGIKFSEQMLSWPAGRRESDGVWARHWYAKVEESSGFATYVENDIQLPDQHLALAERAEVAYQALYKHRLRAN